MLSIVQTGTAAVVFSKDSDTVYQYRDSLTDANDAGVSAAAATVTQGSRSVTISVSNFDATYEGSWSCGVEGSTQDDVQSGAVNIVVTSIACESKFLGDLIFFWGEGKLPHRNHMKKNLKNFTLYSLVLLILYIKSTMGIKLFISVDY